jgi:hypothetical protein
LQNHPPTLHLGLKIHYCKKYGWGKYSGKGKIEKPVLMAELMEIVHIEAAYLQHKTHF